MATSPGIFQWGSVDASYWCVPQGKEKDKHGCGVCVVTYFPFKWFDKKNQQSHNYNQYASVVIVHHTFSIATNYHSKKLCNEEDRGKPATVSSAWPCPVLVAALEGIHEGVQGMQADW